MVDMKTASEQLLQIKTSPVYRPTWSLPQNIEKV